MEGELAGDKYPQIPQGNATADSMVWTGWFNNKNESSRYADYANQPVGADAADLTFDAHYDAAEAIKKLPSAITPSRRAESLASPVPLPVTGNPAKLLHTAALPVTAM